MMKYGVLAVLGVLLAAELVVVHAQFGQRLTLRRSIRRCPRHVPLAINETRDVQACNREVAQGRLVNDPDVNKRIDQIIIEHGFTLRTYNEVTTPDGYILTIYRITGGARSPPAEGKPAVLLAHGMGSSSEAWVALPSDQNLAFKLANAGYEVWLVNHRGSTFSQRHLTLNANNDLRYWNFSWHEMGIYDLPVIVDLMLAETGLEKVSYIGHSQGGTTFLVGAAEVPSFNDKIMSAYLMAPAAFLGGAYDRLFVPLLPILNTPLQDIIFQVFRGRVQNRDPRIITSILGMEPHNLCLPRALLCGFCDDYFLSFYTFNPSQMNYTNIPNMMAKMFNTNSVNSLIHFGQNILSCMFRQYDHGERENLRRYGTLEPPSYNLGRITAPTHILWAEQDGLVTPSDIRRLVAEMNPAALRGVHRPDDDTFNHGDFGIGKDADKLVYEGLIEMLNRDWGLNTTSTVESTLTSTTQVPTSLVPVTQTE